MKETPEKKEAGKNYQSSFLRNIFNKSNDTLEFKIKNWNPKYCGDIDMRIASDGTWFYCGSPINRKKLVKLFSSILINENNKYFLITPVEKVGIIVDDAPFIANDFEKITENNKSYLVFFTNIDETIVLSKKNPFRISINDKTQEPSPYIMVRKNIEAKIDRKSFYRLVDFCTEARHKGESWLGFHSNNIFFPLAKSEKLD